MQASTSCHHASRFSIDMTECMPTRATSAVSTIRPPTRSTARSAFIGGEAVQSTCHQGNGPRAPTSCRLCYKLRSAVNSGAGAAAGACGRFYRVVWGLPQPRGGAVQHHWRGVDHSTRGAMGLARTPQLDAPMHAVSILGNPEGLIPLTLISSLLLWHSRRRWALALPPMMVGTGGLQRLSKWALDRPRPNLAAWGFPSGHVLSLVVFFGLVAYLLLTSQLGRTWRWVGSGISFGVLLAVAFSRLYLDVHWLSDVFG